MVCGSLEGLLYLFITWHGGHLDPFKIPGEPEILCSLYISDRGWGGWASAKKLPYTFPLTARQSLHTEG